MAEPTSEQVAAFAAAAHGEEPETPAAPETPEIPAAPAAPETYAGTYRDRAAAEAGIAEKDRLIGELGNRAGEAERRLGELEAQFAQTQQQAQYAPQPQQGQQTLPDGTPIYSLDQLNSAVEAGQITEFYANAIYSNQQAQIHALTQRAEIEQRFAQLEAPVRQMAGDTVAKTAIDQAKALLGASADQLMHDNKDAVLSAVQAMPDVFKAGSDDAGTAKLRGEVLAQLVLGAEAMRQNGVTPPTPPPVVAGNVHVEGGSGAQPGTATTPQSEELDPGDPRRSFGQAARKDAFGTLPAFAGDPYRQ